MCGAQLCRYGPVVDRARRLNYLLRASSPDRPTADVAAILTLGQGFKEFKDASLQDSVVVTFPERAVFCQADSGIGLRTLGLAFGIQAPRT